MIFAMHRSLVLTVLAALIVAAAALLVWSGYADNPGEVFEWRGTILLGLNGLVLLLCWRPALWLVHKITFAKAWWFPWLDGEWSAEIRSNWPKVKGMFEAARGDTG